MKNADKILICLIFLLIHSACERDADFRGKELAPKMAINSVVCATAETHTLKLSESVFVFGQQKPQPIEDAELILKINGIETPLIFVEQPQDNPRGEAIQEHGRYYSFTSSLKAGDKLEISGNSLKHGAVNGIDYIPDSVEIADVKTEWFVGKTDDRDYLRTLITIKDKPHEKNYYRIVIRGASIYEEIDQPLIWSPYDVFIDQEILFNNISGTIGSHESASYMYRVFSDELFNGEEYTLNVYVQNDRFNWWGLNETRFVKVEIHTLSQNLYMYLRSLELAMSEDNFSEPTKIYSNIEKGYGVLGTYNVASMIKEIPK